jgi:hypothetical protein
MERTECSETSVYKIQTTGNYPEESIQHSEHGESLKSRILVLCHPHGVCNEGSVLVYVCDECQMNGRSACRELLSALWIAEIVWPGEGLSHEFSYHVSQIKIYCIMYTANICTTNMDLHNTTVLCLHPRVSSEPHHLQGVCRLIFKTH